jgi:hypothetical protein
VHRAELVKLGRAVAIKFLRPAFARQPDFVKRFEREALAMSRLYHHHCVSIIDFGVHEDSPYLVMEYVPGQSLSRVLRDGPLPAARAVRITQQILDTLAYFHRRNVLHRDLKAENIMIAGEEDSDDDFVMLLDFGMAKLLAGVGADISVSAKGIIVGTPSAMSPEQIREQPLDGRADLYSTGVMLYHMLCGRRPFQGDDMVAVFKMHLEKPVPPPTEIAGTRAMSPELEAVVLKALEKNRDDRFADAAAMEDALAATPEAQQRGRRASTIGGVRLPSAAPRSWLAYAGWPVAAILAVVLGVTLVRGGGARPATSSNAVHPPDAAIAPPDAKSQTSDAAAAPDAAEAPTPVLDASVVDATVVDATVVDTTPWNTELDNARARIRRLDYDGSLRVVASLVRAHPEAHADPQVIDTAIASLAPYYGDRFIDVVLRLVGKDAAVIDALARAMTDGDTWYLRHHAWLALRRAGHADRADQVALWIADLARVSTCAEERRAVASLRGSRDPRAIAALSSRSESRCSSPNPR